MTADSSSGQRWLVLGLGNPDARYGATRHNVGAACVTLLTERLGVRMTNHRSGALLVDTFTPIQRVPVTLGRPGGYMNTSGAPAQRALAFYTMPLERLVVVHDDLDLPLGSIRLKHGGGTGGHNGLKDIQRRCGGNGFHRVRLGVGRPPGTMAPSSYVLQAFRGSEHDEVAMMLERGADTIVDLVEEGLEAAQNRYHAG